jgi:hypothetical protein
MKSNQPASTDLTLYAKAGEVQTGAAQSVDIGGVKFVIAKRVNVPILKHETGETVAVRIDAPIMEEPTQREVSVRMPDGTTQKMMQESTINVVRVTELYSNEPFQLVLNTMSAGDLRNTYPDHDYVGRLFAIQKGDLVPGKQYKQVNVVEIEPEHAPG